MNPSCKQLKWDSEHFGFPVASYTRKTISAARWSAVRRWCVEHRIRCLYMLADAGCGETARVANAADFFFADVRADYHLQLAGAPARFAMPAGLVLRDAVAGDLRRIRAIAAASHEHSRFYFDRGFGRVAARKMFEIWATGIPENTLESRLIIADIGCHRTAGYVKCSAIPDSELGRIDLIAVDSACRGKGVGTALVNTAVRWLHGRNRREVSVATQFRNIPSQRLYQACGFGLAAVNVWYHRWFS